MSLSRLHIRNPSPGIPHWDTSEAITILQGLAKKSRIRATSLYNYRGSANEQYTLRNAELLLINNLPNTQNSLHPMSKKPKLLNPLKLS